MSFRNRIRLPFYVTRPQFPTESNTFRLANGTRKTLSSVIRKLFEGETENLPREIHERFIIALKHDDVTIEGKYYLGGVSLEGDYEIDWIKFLDYPLAKAAFKVDVTPFNYSNDNCQTCEEATQLSLEDDTVTGAYESLDEGQQYEFNVFENDSICCKPITAEITTINPMFVSAATIDAASGIVTIDMQAELPSATNVNLLTYRVTCPNGSYDEANVFANVSGTAEECLSPINLEITSIGEASAQAIWQAPIPAPPEYHWELYLASDLLTPIFTGNIIDLYADLESLSPSTEYRFYVRSTCIDGISEFIYINFTTNPPADTESCGQYQIYNPSFPGNFSIVTYIDCAGNEQNLHVQGSTSVLVCALQTEPGAPVSLFGSGGDLEITYFGLC
jgi:hypothetical protein